MSRFDFTPEEIEDLIFILNKGIDSLEKDKEDLKNNHINDDETDSGKTQEVEAEEYDNMLDRYEAEIAVFEEIKRGSQEFLDKIDENVGLKTEKFVFEEDIVKPELESIIDKVEDPSTYDAIVTENDWFDVWELGVPKVPTSIPPTSEELKRYKAEESAYNYDRSKLDDLNDTLHKGCKYIESLVDEIKIDYDLYFSPLEGYDLINEIIDFMDLEVDIDASTFRKDFAGFIVQGNPKYGHRPKLDELPDGIKKFMKKYNLSLDDFVITDDGFITCKTSLNDILMQIDEFTFPDINDQTYKFNSKWYLYAIIDENGEIHISTYKLQENDVRVSFIEMNEFLYDENGNFSLENLTLTELYKVCGEVELGGNGRASYFLSDYFKDISSDGSFVISDLLVDNIINDETLTNGNVITIPDSKTMYDTYLDDQDRELLERNGCYDPQSGTITVGDINNLTIEEYNTIMLLTTGDSSSYALDQEIIYHAERAHGDNYNGYISGSNMIALGDMIIDKKVSDSGEVMNAGNGEAGDFEESLNTQDSYHKEESDEIANIKGEHPAGDVDQK